jgi:hypothetical protein
MTCIESNLTDLDKRPKHISSNLVSMNYDTDKQLDPSLSDGSLETADSVARAAHIWIRSVCLNEMQGQDERYSLAGGLIAGLCERLALNPRIRVLVAYVYTLLDNEGDQALTVSRMMLEQPAPPALRHAYDRGRSEAAGIVEMLTFHDREPETIK